MQLEKFGSHQLLKSINQQKVVHLIFTEGPISRVELAEKTGLTQQTVTNIVNRLLEEKLVQEGEPVSSTGGRKPVPLTIKGSHLHGIGIVVAGKYVRGSLLDFGFNRLGSFEREVTKYESEQHLLDIIYACMDDLLQHVPDRSTLKGVGLSVQGLVDSRHGVVLRSPGLRWVRIPVKERMEDKYGIPIFIENDVNLLSLKENVNGVLSGSRDNLTIKFDYGIGGAIISDNKLVAGASFVAGEVGHYKAFFGPGAHRCFCGGTGCLTTLASISGLQGNTGQTFEEFLQRLREGRPEALELRERIMTAIGVTVSNLITILNPDQVLLTGRVTEALSEQLMPRLRDTLKTDIPETCRNVELKQLAASPDETALAVGFVMKNLFDVPVDSLSL
ncbi:ROK family transcriptional regulator [Paenibacillus lutrae]|uniref:ROK family protein n=1 Tax=Paenibacillus lutrae TaxID=2078573 RepID=A0A7X3FL77_9BACL|nr:ROK family transcriptional regulator [Paenibacillus lutrae]MVP01352.1 ROK family protein [Paenibacillus lutrae]